MLPRGHIHPQKNLPNIKVRISITTADIIPGMIILPLKEVNMTTSGSILKNKSVWTADQRIYTNNERKNIWLDLLAKINFFRFFISNYIFVSKLARIITTGSPLARG
jgi:hypothetical protein